MAQRELQTRTNSSRARAAADAAADLFDLALRYWTLGRLEDALRLARLAEAILPMDEANPPRLQDVAGAVRALEQQLGGRRPPSHPP
jgi:hypothetical protein